MMDGAILQGIAAVGGMILALITLSGAWTYWLFHGLERKIDGVERNLRAEINRNHREILALLEGHTHGDGTAPVFHRLSDGSGD